MEREVLLSLLEAALAAGEIGYARRVADAWLADWPGDLAVQLGRARASYAQGALGDAAERLENVLQRDPEWLKAWEWLAEVLSLRQDGRDRSTSGLTGQIARDCIAVLRPPEPSGQVSLWARSARAGRLALLKGHLREAGEALVQALEADLVTALPWLLNFRVAWESGEMEAAIRLGEETLAQWPRCVALQLGLADCLNKTGSAGVAGGTGAELLHAAVTADLGGQVARCLWPAGNPYASLWPVEMRMALSEPIPAAVAALLGWNQLVGGQTSAVSRARSGVSSTSSRFVQRQPVFPDRRVSGGGEKQGFAGTGDLVGGEGRLSEGGVGACVSVCGAEFDVVRDVRVELEQLAMRIKRQKRGKRQVLDSGEDSRAPAYIVLASQAALRRKYGKDAAESLLALIRSLARAIGRKPGWLGYAVLPDSADSLAPFGLQPVESDNAWEIKLLLRDLDAALAAQGAMIGAVLLVGGHDLLPFHLLPNPTDDMDDEVPSDNPYATRDENYFVPEWPVGRLPTGKGNDPAPLTRQLRTVISRHSGRYLRLDPLRRLPGFLHFSRLVQWLYALTRRASRRGSPEGSFGYSASVWKPASLAVFRMIGEPRDLLISPPMDASRLPGTALSPGVLSYFNLHGVEDGPDWYGQRNPEAPISSRPEYPIALRPADVVNSGRAPQIVFSEACYGANVSGKAVDEAMCLKFLDSGSRAVIGSTKIAYGSVTTPLIGADLLGKLFWEYLTEGLVAGEALRRAKISLARVMHQRQGYLDGEDQKTLISFVFYGDPLLLSPTTPGGRGGKKLKKGIYRTRSHPEQAPIACTRLAEGRDTAPPDPAVLDQVRSIVAKYLPGMQEATYTLTHPHAACSAHDHNCPTADLGAKNIRPEAERNVVVTLSKVIQASRQTHPHFARLTMSAEGKVLKLAVSR